MSERNQSTQADEYALIIDRIPEDSLPDDQHALSTAWFPTKRKEKSRCVQLGAALDLQHERGELQAGLWMWQKKVDLDAAISPTPILPPQYQAGGLSNWYGHLSERMLPRGPPC